MKGLITMTEIINKVEMIKPSYFKASPLLIAKMTANKLKSYSMYREAEAVSRNITGCTSIDEAYRITSKYVRWKKRYEHR